MLKKGIGVGQLLRHFTEQIEGFFQLVLVEWSVLVERLMQGCCHNFYPVSVVLAAEIRRFIRVEQLVCPVSGKRYGMRGLVTGKVTNDRLEVGFMGFGKAAV